MAEFMVDIWDGNIENRHVTIEDFSAIKGWGTPIGTVTAILTKARWGECTDMPGDYRRRSDAMTINGDGGIWEGTMGGRHFRIRNLAFFPQEEKKRRKKDGGTISGRMVAVDVDQPAAGFQGLNIAPGVWRVVERAPAAAPAAFWYDAVQPQAVAYPLQGNVVPQPEIQAANQQWHWRQIDGFGNVVVQGGAGELQPVIDVDQANPVPEVGLQQLEERLRRDRAYAARVLGQMVELPVQEDEH